MKFTYLLLGIVTISLSSFVEKVNYEEIKMQKQPSEGEKLVSSMDCVGCHKLDKKLIGPSYLEIAKKYPLNDKNINYISSKIMKGSTGVWGNIPMPPHASLSKDNSKKMARYILSLKK